MSIDILLRIAVVLRALLAVGWLRPSWPGQLIEAPRPTFLTYLRVFLRALVMGPFDSGGVRSMGPSVVYDGSMLGAHRKTLGTYFPGVVLYYTVPESLAEPVPCLLHHTLHGWL